MQDDEMTPTGCAFTMIGFRLADEGRLCKIDIVLTQRQLGLFREALATAHEALLIELDACSSNGDEEGAQLRWDDSCILEQVSRVLASALGCMEGMHGLDPAGKSDSMTGDSAGAEAPSHDATSASSADPLASHAESAQRDDRCGALGAGGGEC